MQEKQDQKVVFMSLSIHTNFEHEEHTKKKKNLNHEEHIQKNCHLGQPLKNKGHCIMILYLEIHIKCI